MLCTAGLIPLSPGFSGKTAAVLPTDSEVFDIIVFKG